MRNSLVLAALLSCAAVCSAAADGLAPKQVTIGVKFAEILDTDLEGLGLDFAATWDAPALNNSQTFSSLGMWEYVASAGVMDLDLANAFDANVGLRVTPQILDSGRITMKIGGGVNVTGIESYQSEEYQTVTLPKMYPDQQTQTSTTVTLKDNESVVLGGLYAEAVVESKVPFLGDIPIVGRLFASAPMTDNQGELLVFITAAIVVDID